MPGSRWLRAAIPEQQQLPAAAQSQCQRAVKAFEITPQRQPAGDSEAADTSRQPCSETCNWEGWEGERTKPERTQPTGSGEKSWEGARTAGAWPSAIAPAKGDAPRAVQAAAAGQSCKSPWIIFAGRGKVGRRRQEEKPRRSFQITLTAVSPTKAPSVPGRPAPRVQPRVTFVHVEL